MFHAINSGCYIAVIGDIIQSKKIQERNSSQKKLRSILSSVNAKYSGDIASKFMITLGDEFQGLLKNGKHTISIIHEIEASMYPVEVRFGIGIGAITTDVDPDMPLGSDGPAYHNARKMVDLMKSSEKKNKSVYSNIMICSDRVETLFDPLVNSILSLCATIKQRWTERQQEIVFDCIRNGDNQLKAAGRMGISQSSIQKSLSASGYYSYIEAMRTIEKTLSQIGADNRV